MLFPFAVPPINSPVLESQHVVGLGGANISFWSETGSETVPPGAPQHASETYVQLHAQPTSPRRTPAVPGPLFAVNEELLKSRLPAGVERVSSLQHPLNDFMSPGSTVSATHQ